MPTFIQDLRYGLRILRKNPGFTAIALIALSLGIGANSAIFSFVDAILLRPLPVAHPEQLVKVNAGNRERFNQFSSYPDFLDYQRQTKTLAGIAAYGNRGAAIGIEGIPFLISVCVVSPNYFPLLGVNASLGQTFAEASGNPDHPLVGVISHRCWQHRFGGDPGVGGRTVRLNRQTCTILGVMPRSFRGTTTDESPDLWIPMRVWTQITGEQQADRASRWMELIGRLAPGSSLLQAQAEIGTIGRQLEMSYPVTNRDVAVKVIAESESRSSWARVMGTILLAVAGIVLLVACVNISNLLVARSEGRRKEIAVRLAAGAQPVRIVRQLLTESFLLASIGASLALLLAGWINRLLPDLLSSSLFTSDLDVRIDGRVVLFTLLVSLLAVFGFGLAPALRVARLDLNEILKQQPAAPSRGSRGGFVGNLLVVVQLALSMMLLVGAGLLARSFWNVRGIDPGFRSGNRLLFWIVPAALGYNESQTDVFYRNLLTRVRGLPGVSGATLVQRPPLYPTEGGQRYRVDIPGHETPPGAEPLRIRYTMAWPNYFESMGIPIIRGRQFSGLESRNGPGSILINEAMARRFWPGKDPVGMPLRVTGKDCEIIGVVADGKYVTLREDPEPYMYLAIPQFPSSDMTLIVNTVTERGGLAVTIEKEIHEIARDLPAPEVSTMEDVHRLAYRDERLAAVLVGCLSVLAAFLAVTGLYGLMSFLVKRRTQEMGIRAALGAQSGVLLHMVMTQSLRLIILGVGVGQAAAMALTRFLSSQLYGVTPTDGLTFSAVAFLLIAVALIACYLPARRAARVDPILALRTGD